MHTFSMIRIDSFLGHGPEHRRVCSNQPLHLRVSQSWSPNLFRSQEFGLGVLYSGIYQMDPNGLKPLEKCLLWPTCPKDKLSRLSAAVFQKICRLHQVLWNACSDPAPNVPFKDV